MTTCSASGKVILFGEHAVVYGRPAIAVPVIQARACATVEDVNLSGDIHIEAPNLGWHLSLSAAGEEEPLAYIVRNTLAYLGLTDRGNLRVTVHAELPIARGMGSGAAISTAIVRALGAHLGREIPSGAVSDLVFETERLYHGTPSGIDNTVIAFEQPIYFVKGHPPQTFAIPTPLPLIIADTGVASSTKAVVGDVRRRWEREPARFDGLFDAIGCIVRAGRASIEAGDLTATGRLMNENHGWLQELGVSSRELDGLVVAAREAGALGAKLCGAGRGGNMIALISPSGVGRVRSALQAAGAAGVITTVVPAQVGEQVKMP